jgi:hypothetical protein
MDAGGLSFRPSSRRDSIAVEQEIPTQIGALNIWTPDRRLSEVQIPLCSAVS